VSWLAASGVVPYVMPIRTPFKFFGKSQMSKSDISASSSKSVVARA
jgi:hypothetical protein